MLRSKFNSPLRIQLNVDQQISCPSHLQSEQRNRRVTVQISAFKYHSKIDVGSNPKDSSHFFWQPRADLACDFMSSTFLV